MTSSGIWQDGSEHGKGKGGEYCDYYITGDKEMF